MWGTGARVGKESLIGNGEGGRANSLGKNKMVSTNESQPNFRFKNMRGNRGGRRGYCGGTEERPGRTRETLMCVHADKGTSQTQQYTGRITPWTITQRKGGGGE